MKPLALLLMLSLLGGCSILPKSEPLDIYLLPATPLASQTPALPWSLRMAIPRSEQLLSGTRIVVLPEAGRVNAYQAVRWSERTPELLHNRLLDGFRDDGRISALSSQEQNLPADLELASSLRRFYSQYRDGSVEAQILLEAQLIDLKNQRIVASRRFSVVAPSAGSQIEQVVAAFGQAADGLSQQLVDWVVQTGSSAMEIRP